MPSQQLDTAFITALPLLLPGLTIEAAEQYVQDGTADLVAFGSAFISTPNIPALVAAGKRTKDLNMAGSDPQLW